MKAWPSSAVSYFDLKCVPKAEGSPLSRPCAYGVAAQVWMRSAEALGRRLCPGSRPAVVCSGSSPR